MQYVVNDIEELDSQGSPHITQHLAFRNYLLKYPDCVRQYDELKRKLLISGVYRYQYQAQKAPFIRALELEAMKEKV